MLRTVFNQNCGWRVYRVFLYVPKSSAKKKTIWGLGLLRSSRQSSSTELRSTSSLSSWTIIRSNSSSASNWSARWKHVQYVSFFIGRVHWCVLIGIFDIDLDNPFAIAQNGYDWNQNFDGTCALLRLMWPATRFFAQHLRTNNWENIQPPLFWAFARESTSDRWISPTKLGDG